MKVTYLHHTPVEVLAQACAMPYQSEPTEGLVRRVWDLGHRSIARHGMISFLVEDVSVSLLTQISRHPHINLTVQSSRYCDMSKKDCVVPSFPFLDADELEYVNDMETVMELYAKWNKMDGYTKKQRQEISKMFLPKASTVNMVVSGNYQAIYEFLQLRTCHRAEWEIFKLADEIKGICIQKLPNLFMGCKPNCENCKEVCGVE